MGDRDADVLTHGAYDLFFVSSVGLARCFLAYKDTAEQLISHHERDKELDAAPFEALVHFLRV